jgi:hypothetical protein
MSSTCFEPDGSSSGRRLYIQVLYGAFSCIVISSLVGRRVCAVLRSRKLVELVYIM